MKVSQGDLARRSQAPDLREDVLAILKAVREEGDRAVLRFTERFDRADLRPEQLAVPAQELEASVGILPPDVLGGLRVAIANVRAVVRAQLRDEVSVTLPQGHEVTVVEVPVSRAGIYAPAGKAAYPSTVIMGAVTARAAGVNEIAVCAPPGPGGEAHPVILAACVLCGVTEVYRMGGAQAIAAMAYGTESVKAVDVIAGPGNAYVQEAKRQVVGHVGIDGIAGPSELVVVASPGADPELVALDLLAQAEHGPEGLVALIATERGLLARVTDRVKEMAPSRPSVSDGAELRTEHIPEPRAALRAAEDIAPEHLQLVGFEVEAMAGRVRKAGCLFVGSRAGTAFGDYVAGSNHVLPTGGAARFQSALSASTFRRRMARVSLPEGAPARLAPAGAAVARAEGFPVHAESMERRA
ncbi:MAG: histidinol dehydrogenase [Thermoleophilaceae bacterium]